MLSVGRESAAKYAGSSLSLDFKGTVWRTEPQIGQRSGWDQFSMHADQHADRVHGEFVIFMRDPDGRFAGDWDVAIYPTSFIVDQEGRLTTRFVGPADWTNAKWAARFERLLPARHGGPDTAPRESD